MSDPIETWLATFAATSAKATLLLGLAAVAALLWRRRPASARHLVWSLAIGGALALLPLATMLPGWRVDVAEIGGPVAAEAATAAATVPDAVPWDAALLAVWLTGALLVLGRAALAQVRVHALARRARPVRDWRAEGLQRAGMARPVALVESAEIALPMTWGVLRPVIGLPLASSTWTRASLDAALAHELAHVQRFDALTQLVAQVACAVYWFHPLAWLAALRMRELREFACDDAVLAGGTRPSEYAEEVLAIVGAHGDQPRFGAAALGMARLSHLKARLFAVLNPGLDRAPLARQRALVMVGGVAALVLALAVIRPAVAEARQRRAVAVRVAQAEPKKDAPEPAPKPPTAEAAPKADEAPPEKTKAKAGKKHKGGTCTPKAKRSAR
jgi:beta-lactamase regulating signal transducer with metallopeptidase domain